MPLDPEKIKQLMAIKNKPKRTGGRGGKKVDLNVRTVATWFALQHRFYDYETSEQLKCANPNCVDPRHKGIMVVDVNGTFMCRYCFLDGWLASNPAQATISGETSE